MYIITLNQSSIFLKSVNHQSPIQNTVPFKCQFCHALMLQVESRVFPLLNTVFPRLSSRIKMDDSHVVIKYNITQAHARPHRDIVQPRYEMEIVSVPSVIEIA